MIKFTFGRIENKKSFRTYLQTLPFVNINNIADVEDFYIKNNEKIISSSSRSILIKGEVQSGKTNNIIYLINKYANSNDYFIYLSGHLNDLNVQNKDRISFALNEMEHNFATLNMNADSINDNQIRRFKDEDKESKLIFFGIKKGEYLKNVFYSIIKFDPNARIIIFDDESDSHTISKSNIELRKQIMSYKNVTKYISVTATPYLNLYKYQNMYNEFFVYKSHSKYTGIHSFMQKNRYKTSDSIDNESSILFNLILKLCQKGTGLIIWNDHRQIDHHKLTTSRIKGYISDFMKEAEDTQEILDKYNVTMDIYIRTLRTLFSNVYISNSKYTPQKKDVSLIVGRENMSRGITYEDLISEYIYMNSKKFNPAVIMQASRWFGSRSINEMVIFMNSELLCAYEECLQLEEMLEKYSLNDSFKDLYDSLDFEYLINLDKI